ncbi:MAG: sodium:proton antiporter [Legionella sp. 40-6]|nr:dicarboxylate/amino acid:cation symporter [Legionella sp.]OJY35941.1 MAG: sodium:proton antiporter [Legionella sp. 40-6]
MPVISRTVPPYIFPVILLGSVFLGGLAGVYCVHILPYLKPWGDIFLNLLFTLLVPLIFFSTTAAVAKLGSAGYLAKMMLLTAGVFIGTSLIAATLSWFVVYYFPPGLGVTQILNAVPVSNPTPFLEQLANLFTVPYFGQLFSHKHILALIIFSVLTGLAATRVRTKQNILAFFQAGEALFLEAFNLLMYFAPVGFFCYFAVLVHELGPQLLQQYIRLTLIYSLFACVYFFGLYSLYAFWAGGREGYKRFWSGLLLPALTALTTCSSAASIPANLSAAKEMGHAPEIYETVIPLGSIIHKEGSVIGGMFKIAFVFGMLQLNFQQPSVVLMAIGVSILVGTVMGAIPGGGMLGELLILSVYGLPPATLMVMVAISIIIDPMATVLNVTGNTVSSMMITRLIKGKNYLTRGINNERCNPN